MATQINQKTGIVLLHVFWLLLGLAALLLWAQPANASRIINSVTLNGGAAVTVAPAASISVTMNVTTNTGGGNPRWRSSVWFINSSPALGACVNHPNHDNPGTYTETFNITGPTLAGTYNALFVAFNDNNCGGSGSPIYTLTNGVTVTPPVVTSIVLNNPNPTALASVSWTVTFNRSVTGVNAGDFSLVAGGGVSGASITSVSGSGTTWTVTANTGSGDGSLGLNLVDNDTIVDAWTNPLGGTGIGNGSFTGPVYTITRVSQFDVVEVAAARATPINTKIAGANFSLDILALNAANAISTGYSGTVSVALVDASSGPCAGMTAIQAAFNVTFLAADNGRKTVSFNFDNSRPNVRVRVISASPAITSCSTDNFAIRPADFASVSASDFDALTAGISRTLSTTTAAGTPFHQAGRPFTLRATAVTATAAAATNYTGSPAFALLTDCGVATACAPSFGTLATGTWAATGPGTGTVITNTASYDEVGAFSLQLQDQTFANVDVADTPATCSNVAPIGRYICQLTAVPVGRFVPDHFTVSYNTPQFGTACGTTFTYVGQPFNFVIAPEITVTARNFAGGITTNYAGPNLWRLTNSSLTYPAAVSGTKGYAAATGSIDTGMVPAPDPGIAQTAGSPGVGTLTFSVGAPGTGLAFTRPPTPVTPFNAEISLQINVIDLDYVAYASNPANFGTASAGNGIAFNNSNTKLMRYGRLRMSNAYGSNLLPLPVPLVAEFATSANSFALNTLDSCTTVPVPVTGAGLTYTGTGTTAATLNSPFINGNGGLFLSAPGNGNSGFADIVINSPAWLDFSWTSPAPAQQDPRARATFTQYKKASQFIYMREN